MCTKSVKGITMAEQKDITKHEFGSGTGKLLNLMIHCI
jgi:hypothetical protein